MNGKIVNNNNSCICLKKTTNILFWMLLKQDNWIIWLLLHIRTLAIWIWMFISNFFYRWTHHKYLIMDNKEVQVFAEQYFSSQNFLNKKILQDISSVRDSIPIEKWEKLTFMDREKVKIYFYDNGCIFILSVHVIWKWLLIWFIFRSLMKILSDLMFKRSIDRKVLKQKLLFCLFQS